MNQSAKNWTIFHLRNGHPDRVNLDFTHYTIIYTAKDTVKIKIAKEEKIIEPETFFFIPPLVEYEVNEMYKTAFIFCFKQDLFTDRLEILYQIKNGPIFRDPRGLAIRNTFIDYQFILQHYYLPVRAKGVSSLIRKNSLINFVEFIIIRIIALNDPQLTEQSKHTYEKEIVDRMQFLMKKEESLSLNATHYADELNISKRTLDNAVQQIFGCTTKKYINSVAMNLAKKFLSTTDNPIKNIAFKVGFTQESNFNNFFKKQTGLTPRQFRIKANEETDELDFFNRTKI